MKHSVAINLSNSELSTPPSPFFSHTADPNKMLSFLMPGTCIYEIQTQIHYLKSKINEMYKRGEKIFIVHCPSIKPVSFASPCIIHFPPTIGVVPNAITLHDLVTFGNLSEVHEEKSALKLISI